MNDEEARKLIDYTVNSMITLNKQVRKELMRAKRSSKRGNTNT